MIDVVIPVYKPDDKFNSLINGLCMQSRKPDKLIVMMTISNNDSYEWENLNKEIRGIFDANGCSDIKSEVHPVNKNHFYHGRTRNIGVAYGRNPYVLLMTQDAVPACDDLIEKLEEVLEMNPEVSQVFARQSTDSKAPDYIRYTQEFNYPETVQFKTKDSYDTLGIKAVFCSNVCCMYRRDTFEYLRGFEDKVIFNEDMIYARKALDAGYTIVYEGRVSVLHYHKYNCRQQFKRNFDLAVSQEMNPKAFEGLSSTAEGKKMVKKILSMLMDKKQYRTAVYYFFLSASKYMGYFFGKRHKYLPFGLKKKFSSNPGFWREG